MDNLILAGVDRNSEDWSLPSMDSSPMRLRFHSSIAKSIAGNDTPTYLEGGYEQRAKALDKRFYIESRSQTLAYLDTHMEVVPLLLSLRAPLLNYFGASACLYLGFHQDPIELDSKLYIGISTDINAVEAFDILDLFTRKVWIKIPRAVRDHVLVKLALK
jgi:hypothetical protein